MTFVDWILAVLAFVFILFLSLYLIGRFVRLSSIPDKSESLKKGDAAEDLVVEALTDWAKINSIPARVYRYPASLEFYQQIDVIFDSSVMENLGIEVKFRTIHPGVRELKIDDICHMNSNGKRQITNQFYGYIRNSGRLGLYAFIFFQNGVYSFYFLPHYVLQEIISKKWDFIYISHIKNHDHSYEWKSDYSDFSDYVSREFEIQSLFFNPNKKSEDKATPGTKKDENKTESVPDDFIDYAEDFYF